MATKVLAGIALALCFGTPVLANGAMSLDQEVALCQQRTQAPGSYQAVDGAVQVGFGGTARGASDITDCIEDLRKVQFGAVDAPVQTATVATTTANASRCERLLNRGNGEAAALAIGAGLLAGYVGVAVHGAVVTNNFQRCMQQRGVVSSAPRTVAASGACGRGSNLLVGGTGYCTSR